MSIIVRSFWICLMLFLLAAGGSEQQPGQQNTAQIGIILPLSGPLAEYGQAARNGFEMAKQDSPELFKGISFVYEDSRYQSKDAISALQKLRRSNSLRALYVWGNHPSEGVAPLAEQYGIPTLAAVSNPEVSRNKNFIIRSINHSEMFSEKLASLIVDTDYQHVAVVLSENSYLNGIYNDLARTLKNTKTKITLLDRYDPADADFRSTIAKINHGDFDSVAVFLMSGQVSQFYRQYAQQQIEHPTFGTDFFESTTEIEQAGPAIKGAVYAHIGTSESFRNDYIQRIGNDLQLAYAGNGYDTAIILATAINQLETTPDASKLVSAIRAQKEHLGVSGIAYYRETLAGGAYFEFPVLLKRVEGSSFEVIQ